MDRVRAKGVRNRTKLGSRLKYTTYPRPPNSPTLTSFVVERRLPPNYKTVKTSSRSTVATSSSLSTYNLDELVETDRHTPSGDPENTHRAPGSPKQAFRTHREPIHKTNKVNTELNMDKNVLSGEPGGHMTGISDSIEEGLNKNVVSDDPGGNGAGFSAEESRKKAPGYDVEHKSGDTDRVESPKSRTREEIRQERAANEMERKIEEPAEGVMETFITNSEPVNMPDSEPRDVKKEERSKRKTKPETFSNKDYSVKEGTEKVWKPVASKPRTGGAEAPRDKCLNECGRCGDSEKKLKLLPCLHSFCMKCLKGQVFETYRKMVQCTLCESRTAVPSSGLDSLENNYYFHFSELSLSENDTCDVCLEKTPSSRCTECKTNLCSDCMKEHLTFTDVNHYVVNVSIEMIGKASRNATCAKHNPFCLELFCINCSQLICGRCVLDSHTNHVTENAEVYAREKRRELESRLFDKSSARLVSNIDDHIKLLKRERERVQNEINNTKDAIKNHVAHLKNALDEFCEQIVGDVEAKGDVYTKSYDNKVETSQQKWKATYITLETLKQIVHRTRDTDFLSKYTDLVDVLSDLGLENRLDIVPHIEIRYTSLMDTLHNTVGRVTVNAKLKKPLKFTEEASIQFPRHVVTIYPVDQVRAWVGFRKHIQQCTKDGTLGLRISVGDYVQSIAKSSGDTIYIACRTCVKALTTKLQLKHLFQLSHEPSDMKFNRNDDLIVSFRDARRVALFSNRGTPLKEFDIRHFGYRFGVRMNDPWKLAITDNHDVLLTDYTSEHVAVFDEDCEMKGAYRSNVYKQASIGYNGGLVYIVDYKRDCLNVFSEDGYFLQSHQLEGLKAPSCVGVLSNCLWIGSWNGLVKCYHIK